MSKKKALEIIQTQEIYLPCPSKFNDPFDCVIRFEHEITPAEYIEAAYRKYRQEGHDWNSIKAIFDKDLNADGNLSEVKQEAIRSAAREFEESNARSGVLSLTEDPLSILMWAHYGDKHEGACVGFERTEDNILGHDDVTHPVVYSDMYPEARFAEIARRDGSFSDKVLFTKARDWSYEKEWRLICHEGDRFMEVPGRITEVILGLRMNPEDTEVFVSECSEQDILVLQCSVVPGMFELKTIELPNGFRVE